MSSRLILAVLAAVSLSAPWWSEPIAHPPMSAYLPPPGTRTYCPEVDGDGRVYAGYIAQQADSSTAQVRVECVYLSKGVM